MNAGFLEIINHGQEEKIRLLQNKVDLYSANLEQYKQKSYNETQVRVDFVNFFFQLLGWDVLNENGLPQHLREVTHEANVTVEEDGESKNKKSDYAFRIGTELLFYLETKKPAVDITSDILPAFQLRRYGWSGNLKISVLTNFTDLYIYDCSVRPVEDDDIGVENATPEVIIAGTYEASLIIFIVLAKLETAPTTTEPALVAARAAIPAAPN